MRIPVALIVALLVLAGCGDAEEPSDPPAQPPTTVEGPLARALREKAESFQAPDDIKAVFVASAKEIAASGVLDRALREGAPAPDFTLKDPLAVETSLSELRTKGPVVVTFYRGKW